MGNAMKDKAMFIEFKVLNERFIDEYGLPKFQTDGSAAMDIRACIDDELEIIEPGETVLINTGFAIHIGEYQVAAKLLPRSGLSTKYGIVLANSVGLIDSDYQGEIMVALHNNSNKDFVVNDGDRIAQMMFVPYFMPSFKIVNEFIESERGTGGFGSTGR